MKKILISLAIIGVVAGITFGITGAFWTDKGTSTNQSFVSGNLNLRLSNDGSSWGDNVSNTWNVDKMVPGGTPYESTLYMKNTGSVNADYLKFTLVNSGTTNMDKVMRITELKYKGESLLTGGAGADLSSYEPPTNCTVTTSHINQAIDSASEGDVICVVPGNYTYDYENGVVDVDQNGVTIASTEGPDKTTISAGIQISVDGVTVKGFKIVPSPVLGEESGVYLMPVLSNITVSDNMIEGQGSGRGVLLGLHGSGAAYNSVSIENNVIHDLGTGIYTNSHTGIIDIQYNTFVDCTAGIGGANNANVKYNKFDWDGEAIGLDDLVSPRKLVIKYNNFLGGAAVNNYGNNGQDATNNWWGDFDPSDQVSGKVNYTSYAGGPFIGFINGQDPYANGFADLDDFERSIIVVENPDLLPNSSTYHTLKMGVQLDGPTTSNHYMGGTVGMNMTVTMGQGPAE
ncbi:MAG: hypothetical protein ACKKMS_03125 [Candidatus Nealsonbacteria bacterium]